VRPFSEKIQALLRKVEVWRGFPISRRLCRETIGCLSTQLPPARSTSGGKLANAYAPVANSRTAARELAAVRSDDNVVEKLAYVP
jgi:hypothetical protein